MVSPHRRLRPEPAMRIALAYAAGVEALSAKANVGWRRAYSAEDRVTVLEARLGMLIHAVTPLVDAVCDGQDLEAYPLAWQIRDVMETHHQEMADG